MSTPESTDLQIVALLRYVDACASGPSPHADCPIAEQRETPPLACLPECRETISALLRRGRSVAVSHRENFDAKQIRLSETSPGPDVLWHTSSLLQEVARAIRSHPYDGSGNFILKRQVFATSSLNALGQRGIDPEALVRHGFGDRLKLGLAGWLARQDRVPDTRVDSWPHYSEWQDIFGVSSESGSVDVAQYFRSAVQGEAQRYIDNWLATAPLMDLLNWRPSSTLAITAPRDAEQFAQWHWLVDRYTQTYLHSWAMSSLRREYSFATGRSDAGFNLEVLQGRTLPVDRIARAIAETTVASEEGIDPSIVGALTEQAVELLQAGERTAAAALFEAARTFSPDDPTLRNNYAFCILLDRPAEARALLEDARMMDASEDAVKLCNLVLAHHLLGDDTTALRLARDAYEAAKGSRAGAYLWEVDDTDAWTVRHVEPRAWVVRLGASIERRQGTPGTWSRLADAQTTTGELSSDPSSAGRGAVDP